MKRIRKARPLRNVGLREVAVFKLVNRSGYAAIARGHLTEGRSIPQAYARLVKACRRSGLALPADRLPKAK